jgi:spermidine/putrescine transport system substrate-binding protein
MNKIKTELLKRVLYGLSRKATITVFFASLIYLLLSLPTIWNFFVHENVLSIYTFSEFFNPDAIKAFEKSTGAKVYVRYFETNEELFAKFKISSGKGYDIVTPSDFMVELLRRDNLLLKLDHNKLTCVKDLDPKLMNAFFDPENQYSLPLEWCFYGIIYRKGNFGGKILDSSLKIIFEPPFRISSEKYKICMLDDAREAIMLAAIYLFGKSEGFTDEEYEQIFKLLKNQKQWIECYTNYGLQYFLYAEIVPMAISSSSYARKIFKQSNKFSFFIPKEGSVMVIENIAIPSTSQKVELAYKFINFMLSRKISSLNSNSYGHLPSNKYSYNDIEPRFLNDPNFLPTDEIFSRLHLAHNKLSLKKIEDIWLGVKFAK